MGISHACFVLSYASALLLVVWQQFHENVWLRRTELVAAVAGLVAHTVFLTWHHPTPASGSGSLLMLAWLLAVFYLLYGQMYSQKIWGLVVLPMVLALTGLSFVVDDTAVNADSSFASMFAGERFWGMIHGTLLLFAAVAISVGFIVSLLYLVQGARLRARKSPLPGMKKLSLERLERINRRGANVAMPLLTAGLLLGVLRMNRVEATDWASVKIVGTAGLWVVCGLLLYMRYAVHVPGRRLAWVTIAAFSLTLLTLVATHPYAHGDAAR